MSLTIQARCKVNLRLEVLGRRPDGYHELLTLFDRISLGDEVTLTQSNMTGAHLGRVSAGVPGGPENLAFRGVDAALRESDRRECGTRIDLVKHVPVGAGLGGGSADAAAALVGVNRLWDLGLSEPRLLEIARTLGADVPFFVHGHLRDAEREGSGRMALASGVGERLRSVPDPPPLHYVLLNPGFEVKTSWAFQAGNFRLTGGPGRNEMLQGVGTVPTLEGIEGGVPRTLDDVLRSLRNDLEPVTAGRHPEILQLEKALLAAGAAGTRMSGSGPTVFGLFASEGDAQRARTELERRFAGSAVRIVAASGA